jgi:hypothetical protein
MKREAGWLSEANMLCASVLSLFPATGCQVKVQGIALGFGISIMISRMSLQLPDSLAVDAPHQATGTCSDSCVIWLCPVFRFGIGLLLMPCGGVHACFCIGLCCL